MTTLNPQQILASLNSSWWVTDITASGQQLPSTMIYFKNKTGKYFSIASIGAVAATVSTTYIAELMLEAAQEMSNMNCIGGITNVQPKNYQVFPIYGK